MQNALALAIKYTWNVLPTARPRAKALCQVRAVKSALVVVSVQKVGSVILAGNHSCAPSEYIIIHCFMRSLVRWLVRKNLVKCFMFVFQDFKAKDSRFWPM